MPRDDLLATTFVQLADTLVDDFDVIDLMTVLADRCVELLDVSAAGILLADGDGLLRVMAASSDRVRLLELFQLQNDEGPCLEAFATGQQVSVPDLTTVVRRWPRFAPEAVDSGFRSVHAVPLRLRSVVLGALNLFHDKPMPLFEPELRIAQALADIASIAFLQDQALRESALLAGQLQHALDSRVVIEQAKGMVAEHGQLDMEAAFTRLRRYARTRNRPLSALAGEVVAGTLPVDDIVAAFEPPEPPEPPRR